MSQPPDDFSPVSPEEDAGEALPLIELETLLARPPSWRKRFTQMGFLLAALVVVLVTFWGISRPQVSSDELPRIQPDPPPPTITISSNVNYGTLTINGQPQQGALPLTIQMHSQPPYTIRLDAPPFQPLTCQLPPLSTIVPYAFNPCKTAQNITQDPQALNSLEMLFSLAALPPEQRQQVTDLVSQKLTTQQMTSVPAQSAIITNLKGDGTFNTTSLTGLLHASAFLVPTTRPPQRGLSCFRLICIGQQGFSADYTLSGQFWEVQTPVALRWRFTTASGHVVSDVTFPASPVPLKLFLSYDARTGWQIAPLPASETSLTEQLSQLVCITGIQLLNMQQAHYLGGDGWTVNILHEQGIEGCELQLEQHNVDQGHFVWRFGALLAADAQAHSTLPKLPIAPPQALAAVAGTA
ncbi:MAG TPA: hypothetical protein VFU69_16645 [Ktedonobacterales bacterium]|nr:hypothetical protein [Ktedonobacterales bacterium]